QDRIRMRALPVRGAKEAPIRFGVRERQVVEALGDLRVAPILVRTSSNIEVTLGYNRRIGHDVGHARVAVEDDVVGGEANRLTVRRDVNARSDAGIGAEAGEVALSPAVSAGADGTPQPIRVRMVGM